MEIRDTGYQFQGHPINDRHTVGKGLTLIGGNRFSGSSSSAVGMMFEGVEWPEDTVMEERQVQAWICDRWVKMTSDIGWFEHTNDWDQYAQVTLYDGRVFHQSGCVLTYEIKAQSDTVLSSEANVIDFIELEVAYDPRDERSGGEQLDEWDKPIISMIDEFGVKVKGTGGEDVLVVRVPLMKIAKINVGWE